MIRIHDLAPALAAAFLCAYAALARATPLDDIAGPWRIVDGVAAPWVAAGTLGAGELRRLSGQALEFQSARIVGGGTLGCGGVVYERVDLPAQGLFQGGLPEPAEAGAAQLGIQRLPAPSIRISCDSGSFDYHFAGQDTLLVALDNVVWKLVFHPRTARGALDSFLRAHFSGDMAFSPDSVTRKERWLSTGLRQAIRDYFAVPPPADEAPLINGDPFTDTQEYPTGFDIARVRADRRQAQVRVSFRGVKRSVDFHLVRSAEEGWRIDDVTGQDGVTLRSLLTHPAQ